MKRQSLTKRLFLAFFLMISVPLPIFFLIGMKGLVPYMERAEVYRLMKDTISMAGNIQARLSDFRSDVLILSETEVLKDLIAEKDMLNSRNRERLETFFVNVARNKKVYYQIRYLDEDGKEIARVDDGVPVPEDKLQDKSHRYYYKEGLNLSNGQVYVSPMDLNREWDKIEMPFRPVLRYVTPVIIGEKRRGMVITNIDAKLFLVEIQKNAIEGVVRPILVNNDGYYFSHTDSSKEWGGPTDLNTGENITKDFDSEIVNRLFSQKADYFIDRDTDRVLSYATIFPDAGGQRNWVFIQETSFKDGQFGTVYFLRRLIIIIALVALVVGTYLSFFLSRWLVGISCEQ